MKRVVKRSILSVVFALGVPLAGQTGIWWQRGFVENRTLYYPQPAKNDSTLWVNESLLRWEFGLRLGGSWKIYGGLDAQTDTHDQVLRSLHLSLFDRDLKRPPFALRTLFAQYTRGPFRLEAGKQVLRWGVADLFPPTDTFAARDALSPSGADYLGTWAVRGVYDSGPGSVEILYFPRFTPSRAPLAEQRWVIAPASTAFYRLRFEGVEYPGGPQFGVRYHRILSPVEFSGCYFEGFQNFPSLPVTYLVLPRILEYRGVYPKNRMVGADVTAPWRGVLWKAESSYTRSLTNLADDYWVFVVQAERLRDKWQWTAGYTGAFRVEDRHTSQLPVNRSFTKSFSGRVSWSPISKNLLSAESFLQQNGKAFVCRLLYSRELARSFRATAGYIWITGSPDELIGTYHINSYATMQFRYSF